jgi:hypothetical protein
MRGQLYDELIPAYEALQERMVADYNVAILLELVTGLARLLRPARQGAAGFRRMARGSAVRFRAWRARRPRADWDAA